MKLNFTIRGFVTAIFCFFCTLTQAQDDQIFGTDNKVWNPSTSYTPTDFTRILVEVNGRILHVKHGSDGGTTVTRYHADGSLDADYGNGGSVYINGETGIFAPKDAVMLPDNKILIVGVARIGLRSGVGVIKLNTNGAFDQSFYGGGKQVIYINNSNLDVNAVAIQPSGKIIVLATTFNDAGGFGPSIIRLSAEGFSDPSFDGDGLIVYPSLSSMWKGVDLTSQPDGKIVMLSEVVGSYQNGATSNQHTDIGFARFNIDGSIDASFGNAGQLVIGTGLLNEIPSNVGIDLASDRIVAFGHQAVVGVPNSTKFLSVKLLPNGSPDPAYGGTGTGIATFDESGQAIAKDMYVQTDGRIFGSGRSLCGANCTNAGYSDLVVLKIKANGALDSSFNGTGRANVSYRPVVPGDQGSVESGGNIGVQYGNLIVGGYATYPLNNGITKPLLVRYNNVAQVFNGGYDGMYVPIPQKIQAESAANSSGTRTEPTSDEGGGSNVGYIDLGDYLEYRVSVANSSSFKFRVRVASPMSGGQLQLRNASGVVLTTINIPNTNGWQNWTTVEAPNAFNLPAGDQELRIYSTAAPSWNINWIQFFFGETSSPTPPGYVAIPAKIEAEAYVAQSGTQNENTSDVDGGQNVGYIEVGDYMDYNLSVPTAGTYNLYARVASQVSGGQLLFQAPSGMVLGDILIPNTGGWQNWTTVSTTVNLPAGNHTFRIKAAGNNWNINWFELTQGTTPPPSIYVAIPKKIEAEAYTSHNGTQTEGTTDAGGGLNVGWMDMGDYLEYKISVPATGTYTFNARVASQMSGANIAIRLVDGSFLTNLGVPNTNGWQNWTTISTFFDLPAGNHTIRLTSSNTSAWNINWIEFDRGSTVPPSPYTLVPGTVQAENYSAMSGIQTEATSDVGGGENVGYIDENDWMEYKIRVQNANNFNIVFRAATPNNGANFKFTITSNVNGSSSIFNVNVPNTGGYQNWTNLSLNNTVGLAEGDYTLRITSTGSPWNINYMQFNGVQSQRMVGEKNLVERTPTAELNAYPNPVRDVLILSLNNERSGRMEVSFVNMAGGVVKTLSLNKEKGAFSTSIPMSGLKTGQYLLRINMNGIIETRKIIKM
jgi:uncharacterized delta-60 repeat protein